MKVEIVRVELPGNVRLVEYQPGARGKEPAHHLATIFLDSTINELTLCGLRARGPMWAHERMDWIDTAGLCGGCVERLRWAQRCRHNRQEVRRWGITKMCGDVYCLDCGDYIRPWDAY